MGDLPSLPAEDDGPIGSAHLRERLATAEHDVAVLQACVGEMSAERDRMAALAASRKRDLAAAREREACDSEALHGAEGTLLRTRAELVRRVAAEAALRVDATGLHARITALKAQVAGHDARTRELSDLVGSLSSVAREAGEDAQRLLTEHTAAEAALRDARARISGLEEQLADERLRLESLHSARDRTLRAEAGLRTARQTEMAILSAARLAAPTPPPPDLLAGLTQAAERLRLQAPVADYAPRHDPGDEPADVVPIEGTAETIEFGAVREAEPPEVEPPPTAHEGTAIAIAVLPAKPERSDGRDDHASAGPLRRLFARLRPRSA